MLLTLVQSALIYALILFEVIAQMAALARMVQERLYIRHAAFLGLTLVTLGRALVGLYSHGHVHPYLEFWKATQWPLAVLGAAAAIEAFWRLALHFRNVRGFGWIVLSVIAGLGILAGGVVRVMNSAWNGPLRGPLMFDECVEVALLIAALLSLASFRWIASIPVRPNAIRHLLVLALLFGTSFVGNFIGLVSRGHARFASNLTITLGLTVSYGCWAIWVRRSGEILPFPIPPLMSSEEMAALDRWDQRLYAEGNGVMDARKKPA